MSQKRKFKAWWRWIIGTLLAVSFEIYKTRRRDILMGRHEYIPLRCLGDVPLRLV